MMRYLDTNGNVTKQFAEMMLVLAEALGARLTESRIRIYARLLGDVPADDLRIAFRRAAEERASGYFPSPGELRRYISGTEDDAAMLAWASLRRAAEEIGAYSTVKFDDGAVATALEIVFGSWPSFCSEEDGPAMYARRQEFMAAYRAARRRGDIPPRQLPGLCGEIAGPSIVGVLTTGGDVVVETAQKLLTDGDVPKG